MIHYAKFHGVPVSKKWWVVLTHMERAGVKFKLNSGHRTIREQTALFHANMHLVGGHWVRRPGHPLTAFPSPNAPHVRTGRAAHALDIEWTDGGITRVLRHLRSHNVSPSTPVTGEPWHMELPEVDLTRLWRDLS